MKNFKGFTMLRNGEEQFVFAEASEDKYIEYYQRWEEDPDSPEGAYGEWKTYHTVSFLPKETVKEFAAKLATIGFVHC